VKQIFRLRAFALAATLLACSTANSQIATTTARIAFVNQTPAQQAAHADVIVIGKVLEIEKEMTQASAHPSVKDKVDFHVAAIRISESIAGAKGLTSIRVGWQPAAPANIPNPQGGGIRIRPPIRQQVALTEGQEGCFFLTKHHDGDFYVLVPSGQPLDAKAADFAKQLETVKKVLKIFEEPVKSLQANTAGDRLFAAAVLLQKYRTPLQQADGKQAKMENVPAEESKLILKAISESEWGKFEQKEGIQVGAQQLFSMLGVGPDQNGFNPPQFMQGQQDFQAVYGKYVKKWLDENSDAYRVQRWVVEK
jgi:hypothetical protein